MPRYSIRYLPTAAVAVLVVCASMHRPAEAGCTNFGPGFPVYQCGYLAWFAPAPGGAGGVRAVWWQLHYGNHTLDTGLGGGGALEGTGNQSPSIFNGNDSGLFSIVLTDAASVLPQYAGRIPAGALCSNYENSWSQPGVDGCVDNPRTPADDDDYLNPYFDATYGSGYYTLDRQVDYPMALLLTESNRMYFALAFVAGRSRGDTAAQRASNRTEGDFTLGAIADGDPNPLFGAGNVIPWQAIPRQKVDAVSFTDPNDRQHSDLIFALSWPAVRIVSDRSVRPSGRPLNNPGNGVGVLDQGPLVRYVVEAAAATGRVPDPDTLAWYPLTTTYDTTATVTVPRDMAIRLRTILGVTPATSAHDAASCRLGLCGDIGYEIASWPTFVGGVLGSEQVAGLAAECGAGRCVVRFETTSELSVAGITLLAVGRRGERVLRSIAPQQGTTGLGASYAVTIGLSELRGAKAIAVRLEGIGGNLISRSAEVPIR